MEGQKGRERVREIGRDKRERKQQGPGKEVGR